MRARAAQADLVVKRKNEENAALQRKLRSTLHGAAEQKVTLNPSNLRRLRHGIISEVENITKLWSLCEELDKNCDTKESLLAEIESLKSKLSKKPEDADLIEDQMESVEGQLQYVNSKIQEVEAELEALALPIPRVLSAEHFKTDRKFFLKYPLNHIEEAKEIILYLINRLIPAVKVRDTLKQANEQLEMELHQVKRELKNREISFSTMEAAFRRNADKREIQLIQKYNESIRDIPDLLIGEDATVDLSNVTLDMGDAGRDEKLKHYYRYTETWRNKIVQKGAENRPIETTRISSLKSKVMSQEARAVSNPRRVKN
jgi:chromosome segregation ATPase